MVFSSPFGEVNPDAFKNAISSFTEKIDIIV